MTAAQTTALDNITSIMREHFDAAVFVFETDAKEDGDPTLVDLTCRYSGTFSQALGLLEYAKHKILTEN